MKAVTIRLVVMAFVIGISLVFAAPESARAFLDNTWQGGAGTDWHTAANWSRNSVPAISDDVIIPAGLANYPVLSAPGTCRSIGQIADGASISGTGTLTISNAAGIVSATGTSIISAPLSFTAGSPNIAVTGSLTISGAISGAATSLIKGGAGTLTLSGANTYDGTTFIGLGTLKLGRSSSVNTSGPLGTTAGGTSIVSGAVLDLNGFSLTGTATEALILNGTGISGGGALTNTSVGGASYAGTITLQSASSIITGGNITIDSTGTITGAFGLTIGGATGVGDIKSVINTGAGTLTKTGTGTWILGGTNTYTGQTSIDAGQLLIQNAQATGTIAGGVTVAAGAQLILTNNITVGNETLTLNGNGVASTGALRTLGGTNTWGGDIVVSSAASIGVDGGTLTASGALSGAGQTLTKVGAGTLVFGANPITLGTLVISSGVFTSTSGTMSLTGDLTNNSTFGSNLGTTTFNGTGAQTIGGSSSTAFNNLTVANTGGGSTTMNTSGSAAGVLTLTSDLTIALGQMLTQSGTSAAGALGDAVGKVRRTDVGGTTRSFGNVNNQITNAGTATQVDVTLFKNAPGGFASAVTRNYTITPGAGTISATLRLRYLDSELNGNAEGSLNLWRATGTGPATWTDQGFTTRDGTNNWVEKTGVTAFSPWTIAAAAGAGPTAAEITRIRAGRYAGGVVLAWETGYEVDNLGFNVYREEAGGRVRVNDSLIAGSALFAQPGTKLTAGMSYQWRDLGAGGGVYWLEEIDLSGGVVWHGPIYPSIGRSRSGEREAPPDRMSNARTIAEMNAESVNRFPTRPVEKAADLVMVGAAESSAAGAIAGISAAGEWNLGAEDAIKLSVKREGFYRVTKSELLAAGLNSTIDARRLQLFVDGQEQPIKVVLDNQGSLSAIEFYGVGIDTPSTDEHIYWLTVGKDFGRRISDVSGAGGQSGAGSFQQTVERRDRSLYISGIRNGDRENFFGTPVVNADTVAQVVNLSNVDQSKGATLEITLQGLSLLSHRVAVTLNGAALGVVEYTAQENGAGTFSLAPGALLEGANTLTLTGQSTVLDVSLVDYIRVTYWHTYKADSNALKLTAAGLQQVSVGGFTTNDIRVIDVTDPAGVLEVSGTVAPQGGAYSVTFAAPGAGSRVLLAFAGDQVKAVNGAVANVPSNWRKLAAAQDFLIISHRSVIDSYKPLQNLRKQQKMKVALVDVEDLYDEFSYGNKSPQAIKSFLLLAQVGMRKGSKYVLLAGGASYDPKNYEGQGAYDLVPTKLVDTSFMETASDDWFVDFDGDSLPDMAIGRLPSNTAAEASVMVGKIVGYETSVSSPSIVLASDVNDIFNFEGVSTKLKPLVPATIGTIEIKRSVLGIDGARQQLLDAIASGQKIVNYSGHGSSSTLRGPVLSADDARAMTNTKLPVFVFMNCLNGLFHNGPLDALAPALMRSPGGAIAVWASSGLTDPAFGQDVLNEELYRLLFPSANVPAQPPMLGDATIKAKESVANPDIRRTWILFGDPTSRLR